MVAVFYWLGHRPGSGEVAGAGGLALGAPRPRAAHAHSASLAARAGVIGVGAAHGVAQVAVQGAAFFGVETPAFGGACGFGAAVVAGDEEAAQAGLLGLLFCHVLSLQILNRHDPRPPALLQRVRGGAQCQQADKRAHERGGKAQTTAARRRNGWSKGEL